MHGHMTPAWLIQQHDWCSGMSQAAATPWRRLRHLLILHFLILMSVCDVGGGEGGVIACVVT
jgi:hypothetical protein